MRSGHEVVQSCSFATDRMLAGEWHALAERFRLELSPVVMALLTPLATAALPPHWQGEYDRARSEQWIEERDAESPTMLIVGRGGRPLGLLLLYPLADDSALDDSNESGAIVLRVGYVLAEAAWGRGLASELVGGLVTWARQQPEVVALVGGVSDSNAASARVLVNNGFDRESTGETEGVSTYRLAVG